ncbi:MAG: hypothetical protein ACRC0G_07850 [Fusobacteriaceae bacterium]
MNPTALLKKIKRRLGVRTLKLSLGDDDLLDIITGETVDTFSTHIPYIFNDFITVEDKVPNSVNTYYLDDCMTRHKDVRCLGVYDVVMSNGLSLNEANIQDMGKYTNGEPSFKHPGYMHTGIESIVLSGALANITSAFEFAREVFTFEAPNKLTITRHKVTDYAQIKFQATHPKDLSTIAITYEEEFFKLSLLNIKIALYAEMKMYDQIETTFGNITLKIDEWSSAEQDRESLIKEWADKYIINRADAIFVI